MPKAQLETNKKQTGKPTNQTNPNKNNKFWDFKASAQTSSGGNSAEAELILYGDISQTSWWGDEVTPKQFDSDLAALGDVDEIVVRINSGGGDVFAANAIYTRLKDHKARITVKIDGWAASAATIIAMAGDTIQIPANGVFMI
ncbi:MAG: Clp protease ClpP, partial [Oscillospiraceae bacterium]|nr:Clp protease ClpP [Oscillospiraceae bacterium]